MLAVAVLSVAAIVPGDSPAFGQTAPSTDDAVVSLAHLGATVDSLADAGLWTVADSLASYGLRMARREATGPQELASIAGRAAYLDGEDVEVIIPLNFAVDEDGQFTDELGWLTVPLAAWNGDAPIATEDATWTGVKGLFR